ncbi:MAG TPA: polysaccharide biosynthesis/export family protein [Pyrinomonadaceae bacterium]|jgi:polysaccharide export outer membrane protein
MRNPRIKKSSVFLSLFFAAFVGQVFAQSPQTTPTRVNFGYSQNPKTKQKKEKTEIPASVQTSSSENSEQTRATENRTVAQTTFDIARRANSANFAPTEVYKVGIGDVLFISLQNAPAKESNYFTVLNNGTIDYPLAGEMISVAGFTAEEIEDLLKEKIKLYENPQISVKLREYASHSITVLGLVEKAGVKYMQREAIPLYVVRAEAVVEPKAGGVTIKRASSQTEKFDLKDSKYEEVLVFPGDIVEFTAGDGKNLSSTDAPQFYYIGGGIQSAGQKDFYQGLTLTQAILASGGLKKNDAKKVIIRRKNEQGLLVPIEYNLKEIKNGKAPDPILQAGDTVEIGN